MYDSDPMTILLLGLILTGVSVAAFLFCFAFNIDLPRKAAWLIRIGLVSSFLSGIGCVFHGIIH